MDNDFATGYALGSDSNGGNCNNGGFWGGDGWWAIIIFAMIFGWGRGGFGGFGGGGASTDPGLQGLATRADVKERGRSAPLSFWRCVTDGRKIQDIVPEKAGKGAGRKRQKNF